MQAVTKIITNQRPQFPSTTEHPESLEKLMEACWAMGPTQRPTAMKILEILDEERHRHNNDNEAKDNNEKEEVVSEEKIANLVQQLREAEEMKLLLKLQLEKERKEWQEKEKNLVAAKQQAELELAGKSNSLVDAHKKIAKLKLEKEEQEARHQVEMKQIAERIQAAQKEEDAVKEENALQATPLTNPITTPTTSNAGAGVDTQPAVDTSLVIYKCRTCGAVFRERDNNKRACRYHYKVPTTPFPSPLFVNRFFIESTYPRTLSVV